MAADLKALLGLRKRRTQRAQDRYAAAERARLKAEADVAKALMRFQQIEQDHEGARRRRVRDILDKPTSPAQLVRIGLQYDVGQEELRVQAEAIILLREDARMATEKVKEAHAELQICLKREKKLEEAVSRLSLQAARMADVHAEMELER